MVRNKVQGRTYNIEQFIFHLIECFTFFKYNGMGRGIHSNKPIYNSTNQGI